MRYRMDTDNDGHWYLYPVGLDDSFTLWLVDQENYGETDYQGIDFGMYGIDDPFSITFTDPKEG